MLASVKFISPQIGRLNFISGTEWMAIGTAFTLRLEATKPEVVQGSAARARWPWGQSRGLWLQLILELPWARGHQFRAVPVFQVT